RSRARPAPAPPVDCPLAIPDRLRVPRFFPVPRRAAAAADPLLAAALGLPHPRPVRAGDGPERARRGVRADGGRRARAPLAAAAVAVAGLHERCADLVADGAAVAAAGEGETGHPSSRTNTSSRPLESSGRTSWS